LLHSGVGDVLHITGIAVAGYLHSGDSVQVSAKNTSARELENTVVKPVRQQLIQVAALKDMTSETRDGAGIIRLSFDFGTNTDLAFIEVNEKIDAAMNYLPKDTDRPK
jgi:multidrug efflux pump subunit AcrB